jgi:hypothetical protein
MTATCPAAICLALVEGRPGSWLTAALASGTGVLGYALTVATNPSASAFWNGLRVLRRYPRIWIWLATFGAVYTLSQIAQACQTGEITFKIEQFSGLPAFQAPLWGDVLRQSSLNTLELVAGLFNQAIASFPASAIAAVLFLLNWRNSQLRLAAAARRGLGRWWIPLHLLVVVCAIAAVLKPAFIAGIYWLNSIFSGVFLLRFGAVIDWFSFQFEYLFGTLVQVYVILLTLAWIRGLNSEPERVLTFALHRTVSALRWAALLLLVTTCAIHLPLLLTYGWIAQQTDLTKTIVEYADRIARPCLAVWILCFCGVQINLVLRNQSLRQALAEHHQFVRRHWYKLLWFLTIVTLHFFLLCLADQVLVGGFSISSVPGLFGTLLFAGLKGVFAAWFLAAWVCLFRSLQLNSNPIRF